MVLEVATMKTAIGRLGDELLRNCEEAEQKALKKGSRDHVGAVVVPLGKAKVIAAALLVLDDEREVLDLALHEAVRSGSRMSNFLHVALEAVRRVANAASRLAGEN